MTTEPVSVNPWENRERFSEWYKCEECGDRGVREYFEDRVGELRCNCGKYAVSRLHRLYECPDCEFVSTEHEAALNECDC